jgi:ribosomal protein L18
MAQPDEMEDISAQIQKVLDAGTEDFRELLELGGLDLTRDLKGADLSHLDLHDSDLSGVDLSNANLAGANLSGANLANANLTGANLEAANLRNASLDNAILERAMLANADLEHASLKGTNLRLADLTDSNIFLADRFQGVNLQQSFFALKPHQTASRAEAAKKARAYVKKRISVRGTRKPRIAFLSKGPHIGALAIDDNTGNLIERVGRLTPTAELLARNERQSPGSTAQALGVVLGRKMRKRGYQDVIYDMAGIVLPDDSIVGRQPVHEIHLKFQAGLEEGQLRVLKSPRRKAGLRSDLLSK